MPDARCANWGTPSACRRAPSTGGSLATNSRGVIAREVAQDAVLVEERLGGERLHLAPQVADAHAARGRARRALARFEDELGEGSVVAERQNEQQLLDRAVLLVEVTVRRLPPAKRLIGHA
jgi:hypothetical protein